jgi:hypothetical protein
VAHFSQRPEPLVVGAAGAGTADWHVVPDSEFWYAADGLWLDQRQLVSQ